MKWWVAALLVGAASLSAGGCRYAGAEVLSSATYECRHVLFGLLATLHYEVEEPEPGRFCIRLTGDASGLAAVMDGHRHQRYESVVAVQDGGRMLTRSHWRQTEIDSHGRRIRYGWQLTYAPDHRIRAERMWGGRRVESCDYPLAPECHGDFLSALLAFQCTPAPLVVGTVMDSAYFSLQGPASVRVTVLGQETLKSGDSAIPVWRCRVESPDGRLPGGYRCLTLWCDSRRQIVQGKCDMLWGLGAVVVRRIAEDV